MLPDGAVVGDPVAVAAPPVGLEVHAATSSAAATEPAAALLRRKVRKALAPMAAI